jgi:Icc-related predicted phosphoesterase
MNIQIASDLHLEFLESRFPGYRIIEPVSGTGVLVLAGDIHQGARAIELFNDWPVPVVYVHGNHELYHRQYDDAVDSLRTASRGSNVRFLECDDVVLNGVRFLGCCLWTDYALYPGNEAAAMREAELRLADHRTIHIGDRLFTAQDALERHARARAWLGKKLAEDFDGKTVVVTHHAPHPKSIHSRYAGALLNGAFASNLAPLVVQSDLWIHGHVHDSFDYTVGGTRVVANPRGYVRSQSVSSTTLLEWENERFDPGFTVPVS